MFALAALTSELLLVKDPAMTLMEGASRSLNRDARHRECPFTPTLDPRLCDEQVRP
jgi:hypothetical protein